MNSMAKRIVTFLLAAAMVTAVPVQGTAERLHAFEAPRSSVQEVYCGKMTTYVVMKPDGCHYLCSAYGKNGSTGFHIELYLQEYRNGSWVEMAAYAKTTTLNYCLIEDVCTYIIPNRRYRTRMLVWAYGPNNAYSFHSMYSSIIVANY